MKTKKITVQFSADDDKAFYIETLIRSQAAKAVQDNGGKSMRIDVEHLPVPNRNFAFQPNKVF